MLLEKFLAAVTALEHAVEGGIMIRVSTLATPRPATMEEATGPQTRDLPPSPTASENSPAMVVVVVIRMGMTRRRAA